MKFLLSFVILAASALAQQQFNGSYVVQGTQNYCADAGANDTYTCSMSPALGAYTTGGCYVFKANTANTGAATINFNSLGAKTIKKSEGGVTTDLSDNDIRAGQLVNICYDGTNMQMQSTLGNTSSGGVTLDTTTAFWTPWPYGYGGSSSQVTGAANYGNCYGFTLPVALTSQNLAFEVTVGSGTCGGTCGLGFGIYNSAGTGIAYSSIAVSGSGTNINTTGVKNVTWASGTAVSGGTLSLSAGKYYFCLSTDSTVLALTFLGNANYLRLANGTGTNTENGYQASFSTGSGGSLALPANKSGTFVFSGSGSELPVVMLK